jgi:hypothetical protein
MDTVASNIDQFPWHGVGRFFTSSGIAQGKEKEHSGQKGSIQEPKNRDLELNRGSRFRLREHQWYSF